eukprot:m.120204 g.120204  ORF g.120204 m.120204 type:complete len:88 (-) comp23220_c0_seq4:708-971(-)
MQFQLHPWACLQEIHLKLSMWASSCAFGCFWLTVVRNTDTTFFMYCSQNIGPTGSFRLQVTKLSTLPVGQVPIFYCQVLTTGSVFES